MVDLLYNPTKANLMKIGIVIQARMGSSRLPGKVLMDIGGQPLLSYIHSRLNHLNERYSLIVATTVNNKDDILADFCFGHKIKFWRGPELDVLSRFFQLSTLEDFDIIVRLNADCPFLDAEFVQNKIEIFLEKMPEIDYASTILKETYPLGIHVEIMTMAALTWAYNQCDNPELREHVTPFIYQNPSLFKLFGFQSAQNNSNLRLTIDYPEDAAFVTEVLRLLREKQMDETVDNIVNLLKNSNNLIAYNQHIKKPQKIEKTFYKAD